MIRPAIAFVMLGMFVPIGVHADSSQGTVSSESAAIQFVDLDGDGLNDNVPDIDGDGIPDFSSYLAVSLPPETRSKNILDFGQVIARSAPMISLALSNSQRFKTVEFGTRALCKSRGCFASGDDFGPGNGIGQSTSTGSCAGGVCRF